MSGVDILDHIASVLIIIYAFVKLIKRIECKNCCILELQDTGQPAQQVSTLGSIIKMLATSPRRKKFVFPPTPRQQPAPNIGDNAV